jgi:hypothetical protein
LWGMRRLFIALMLLPLAGCSPDKKAITDRCVAKARTESQQRPANMTEEEYTDSLGPSITECMKAAGYVFYPGQPDCDDGSRANFYCYATKK